MESQNSFIQRLRLHGQQLLSGQLIAAIFLHYLQRRRAPGPGMVLRMSLSASLPYKQHTEVSQPKTEAALRKMNECLEKEIIARTKKVPNKQDCVVSCQTRASSTGRRSKRRLRLVPDDGTD